MPVITLSGRDAYYEMRGSGRPVLLLAGLGSDSASWSGVVERLAPSFRTIVIDNRGCGRSEVPKDAYSVADLADDAAQLLDELKIRRADVIGHSMGGFIAQEMALRHTEQVSKLVLASTSLVSSQRNNDLFDSLALWMGNEDYASWVRRWVPWLFSPQRIERAGFVEEFVSSAVAYPHRQTPEGFRHQVRALKAFDARGRARDIMHKTIVIEGEMDLLIGAEEARGLAEAIPGSDFSLLPGLGHSLPAEGHTQLADRALSFLREEGS
jgi:pimeloyl-ACP methyl ester carboxylesterase